MQVFSHVLLEHWPDGYSEKAVLQTLIELPVKLDEISPKEIQDTYKHVKKIGHNFLQLIFS